MNPVTAQSNRRREQRRLIWAAVLTAVMIHALLVVLFRYLPTAGAPVTGDLPAVEVLDISKPENKLWAQWLKYHDPGLITQSHPEFSYSRILKLTALQTAVEDLPRPPQLTQPRLADADLAVTSPIPIDFRNSAASGVYAPQIAPRASQIMLNGQPSPELQQELWWQLKRTPTEEQYPIGKLTVLNCRRSYVNIQIDVARSCGQVEFDRIASGAVRHYFSRRTDLADGIVTVEWGSQITAPEIK